MERRVKIFVLLVALLLFPSQFTTIYAHNIVSKALLAEQAKGKAPNVKVYLTGADMTNTAEVSGMISEFELVQNGAIETFEESGEGIRYIILLDNSGSINRGQFEEAKAQLAQMRRNMKNSDEMQIFTVGTTDISADKIDVLGRIADASENQQVDADCEKIKNVEYIPGVKSRTILYRSLNEVLEEQASQRAIDKNRTVIILITDGEDDSDELNGRNNDKNSTLTNVKDASIPVYGILLNSSAKKPNEEKIKFTKNEILNPLNCKGYYYSCSDKKEPEVVTDAFKALEKVLRKDTYVVSLLADSNKTLSGKSELELVVNNQSIDTVWLDYSDYEKDDEAPVVIGIVEKEGRNSINFTIEDENGVNFTDVGDSAHYTVQRQSNGKSWTIEQVNVNPDGISANVTLIMNEADFLNGEYVLVIDGIRDESQDKNSMKEVEVSFTVEDGLNPSTEARKEAIQKYWWIGLIVIVIVLGIVGLVFLRKKSVKVITVDGDELNKADRKLIRLTVTDRLGTTRDVEYNVEGSLFVGRSDICEIFFDDDRLSKQHFVIEVTKMGCYIEDLDSTNKTFVNGVKITNRRLLLDGDVITAGRETFVIHMEKNQFQDDEDYEYKESSEMKAKKTGEVE